MISGIRIVNRMVNLPEIIFLNQDKFQVFVNPKKCLDFVLLARDFLCSRAFSILGQPETSAAHVKWFDRHETGLPAPKYVLPLQRCKRNHIRNPNSTV